jgi:hypothetical protein
MLIKLLSYHHSHRCGNRGITVDVAKLKNHNFPSADSSSEVHGHLMVNFCDHASIRN